MKRHPIRFVSHEDRAAYRKCMRNLAMIYVVAIGVAIGATALRLDATLGKASAQAFGAAAGTSQLHR